MRIGIFDSGVGGLIIAKAIRKMMSEYDYVYLGDTKRVPYGNRSYEAVFEFTKEAMNYLFKKENCAIVIIACNTASARALRRIQREYLVDYNATRRVMGESVERKILGVLIPTAEECTKYKRVGILGTAGTINSNTFPKEIKKVNSQKKKSLLLFHGSHSNLDAVNESNLAYAEKSTNFSSFTTVFQNPAPMLVPLIEEGERVLAKEFLKKYLKPFLNKKLDAVALGCTHYPFYKSEIKKILGPKVKIISQDEIIPKKLKEYFARHPEVTKKLTQNSKAQILVTDLTPNILKLSKKWFGGKIKPKLISL
ncbi:MAG: aspartate/glutamate racemase family protein [Candidatus Paceibacterota bacterium]|jgi:glutamate racemase